MAVAVCGSESLPVTIRFYSTISGESNLLKCLACVTILRLRIPQSMKAESGLILIKKRYGRFVRAVAVFFLLFTGADILMPQYFCDDEIGGISPPITSAATSNIDERAVGDSKVAAVSDLDDSRSRQPSDSEPHEEDCFCCCAHVLPSLPLTSAETSEVRQPMAAFVNDPLPSPPLRGTYHPPRNA